MIGARSNNFVCRVVAAVALLVAPMVTIERAEAQCTPATSTATPANNTTVTCSGTTQNQNTDGVSNFGYGTGNETGITIDVQSGASVTGTGIPPNTSGIFVHDGTIDNHGLVTVSALRGIGIQAGGNITVTNSGGINFDSAGHGDIGVFTNGNANVTNNATGIIFGNLFGIEALSGTANVTNAGTVQAGGPNGNGIAINAGTVNVTNNTGFIAAVNTGGTAIKATGDATVTNAVNGTNIGNILADHFGVDATNANVTNSGVIQTRDTGIHATGTATVSNTGNGTTTGIISGAAFGIDAGTVTVNANTGTIEATANGIAIETGVGGTATVKNNGLITAGGVAIDAATVDVTNRASALIESTGTARAAIAATTVTVNDNAGFIKANADNSQAITATGDVTITSNTGTIQANGNLGKAINGANVTVSGNSGTIEATGTVGTAIKSDGTATVHNSGTISANGQSGVAISGSSDVNVDNSNSIQATGQGGTAITSLLGKATVNNFTTGTITAERFTIHAFSTNITNAGVIEATGSLTSPTVAIIAANDVTVTSNTGTIRANADGGRAINGANVTVTSTAGRIQATGPGGTAILASGLATVANSAGGQITGGVTGIHATTLAVTNALGATISGGTAGIQGSGTVTNAGTISGAKSVNFTGGAGTNTLILQTGSVLRGDAGGSIGATNKLILQGQGAASSNFKSFDTLDVNASGVWNLGAIGGTSTIGVTAINSGVLDVNSTLISQVTVNSGGALAGLGIVSGDVAVASGGAVAPGASFPFKTLNVSGNVNFQERLDLPGQRQCRGAERFARRGRHRHIDWRCRAGAGERHLRALVLDPV